MKLTIALERYDRHVPIFDGAVPAPKGFSYEGLEVGMVGPRRHGIDRHGRMLRDREFDVCEVSLASYIMARGRGAPFTAVPVFPRRLFSQNHLFVNVDAGVRSPKDLVGRRVGVWSFQATMSVLAKGDLKFFYGVPWQDVRWVTEHDEEVPWDPKGASVVRAGKDQDIAEMLVAGELDAIISPHPSARIQDSDKVTRLFSNAVDECTHYFGQTGYYPIMHLLALKQELAEEYPDLPLQLIEFWEESKRQSTDFYHDPGYALLPFARNEYERQARTLAGDVWHSGYAANQKCMNRFIDFLLDQTLIPERLSVETLFHPSTLAT